MNQHQANATFLARAVRQRGIPRADAEITGLPVCQPIARLPRKTGDSDAPDEQRERREDQRYPAAAHQWRK
ncbi:MAG: hypothetical protein ABIS14_15890 [Sphingomonas sp.]